MRLSVYSYVLIILMISTSCFQETVSFDSVPDPRLQLASVIRINGKDVFLDSRLDMIRFPVSPDSLNSFSAFISFNENSKVWFGGTELKNNRKNDFGNVEIGKPYTLTIECNGTEKEFQFIFTKIPVIQIITDTKIWDEPKSLCRIVVEEPEKDDRFSSYGGIEYRGQSSKYVDKKSLGFRLWRNNTNTIEYSESLLGLKRNSDWILNSAAFDPSGIRNLVSFEIWNNMDKAGAGVKANHHGVKHRIVELFINNRCQGFYIFSEYINQQFFTNAPGDVLYKAVDWAEGATKFETFNPEVSPNCNWNGWEQIVPDCKEVLCWEPLYNLYEVAITSDDSTFKHNISRLIDMESFIDYYLFLNLIFAGDNTGKNVFFYWNSSKEQFQIVPWDLDGSWGISFDGAPQSCEGVLTNALYIRLFEANPDDFINRVKNRWNELRETNFNESEIIRQFSHHINELNQSGIIDIENQIWKKNMNLQDEQNNIQLWLADRLIYLDNYFNTL
jgi:spore coat protein H